MDDLNIVREFCRTKDHYLLDDLSVEAKETFIIASNFCLKQRIGRQDLSQIVLNTLFNWEYIIIPKGTLLFRGSYEIPSEANRATYYAPEIKTANIYLPTKQYGYMNVYKVKRNLRLFKLNSLHNANLLLRETFPDKTVRIKGKKLGKGRRSPDKTLYDIIRFIYTGEYVINPDTKPHQITRLKRSSIITDDFVFANWICDNAFSGGYYAETMKQKLGFNFPAEAMICKPKRDLELQANIQMRKTKSSKKLQDIVDQYS